MLAAGDIADCGSQGDEATARLLDAHPGTIAALGDIAYPEGRPQDFRCYDASWGKFRARTRPAVGQPRVPDAERVRATSTTSALPPATGRRATTATTSAAGT